jgi:hypothetical protein
LTHPLLALASLQVVGTQLDGLVLMAICPLGEGEDGVVLLLNLMNLNEGINNFVLVTLDKDMGANNLEEMPKNESLGNNIGRSYDNSMRTSVIK